MIQNNKYKLAALTMLHFTIDFYAGLRNPLVPTLTTHLNTTLGAIIFLTAGCGVIVNFVQPTFGAFIAKKGFPLILVIGPAMAAVVGFIGLTDSYVVTAIFFTISALGIGLVHPEAAVTANEICPTRLGLGMSIFVSGGYFGYSVGNLVAGWWGQKLGLNDFWILIAPGIFTAVFIFMSGLHKIQTHSIKETNKDEKIGGSYSFWPIFALGVSLATCVVIFINFFTIYITEKYGKNYQGFAGSCLFVFGMCGAFGSFFWGYMSDKKSRLLMIFVASILSLPFVITLYEIENKVLVLFWVAAMGLTTNACFSIIIILAQKAKQFTKSLRTAISIGGTWGIGMIMAMIAGYFSTTYSAEEILKYSTILFSTTSVLLSGGLYFLERKKL